MSSALALASSLYLNTHETGLVLKASCASAKLSAERLAAIKSLEVIADVSEEIAPAVVSIVTGS
ncbi:hypothetical protein Ciccas_012592 [Cichlidogyrus casuarinus]|uniref:Uncharacterized protein n=1 Tax=Cichlidogyrus casuarinus TaxID=1844966 RepID=A0ABD2PNE8_9PLAT